MRNVPGYSRHKAPAIALRKDEHLRASRVQRRATTGGSLKDERAIAAEALQAAGLDAAAIRQALKSADDFAKVLGLSASSTTRIPKNRRLP